MWRVKLLRFPQCIKIDVDVHIADAQYFLQVLLGERQKTWSCWCNVTVAYFIRLNSRMHRDTICQTVTSSSQRGGVNKDTCHAAHCRGRTIQVAFSWTPIQGSMMIASRRFPATWCEYDALCFRKIKIFLRFLHEWCTYIFGAVWGRPTRHATKATQNVRYFPQEVSCGTKEAFAQNTTRDCRGLHVTCKLITPERALNRD